MPIRTFDGLGLRVSISFSNVSLMITGRNWGSTWPAYRLQALQCVFLCAYVSNASEFRVRVWSIIGGWRFRVIWVF